jgi:hypothetical protein
MLKATRRSTPKIATQRAAGRLQVVAALLGLLTIFSLTAAWAGRPVHGKARPIQQARLIRKTPHMTFVRGRLSLDNRGRWQVGDMVMTFDREHQDPSLQALEPREGQEVLAMGYQKGGEFILQRAMELPPEDMQVSPPSEHEKVVWSVENPAVGQGEGPQ